MTTKLSTIHLFHIVQVANQEVVTNLWFTTKTRPPKKAIGFNKVMQNWLSKSKVPFDATCNCTLVSEADTTMLLKAERKQFKNFQDGDIVTCKDDDYDGTELLLVLESDCGECGLSSLDNPRAKSWWHEHKNLTFVRRATIEEFIKTQQAGDDDEDD